MGFQTTKRNAAAEGINEMHLALANGGALNDCGLLTLLLSRHLPNREARRVADRLLDRFKTLSSVLSSKLDELVQTEGVDRRVALDLVQVRHLLSAMSWAMVARRPVIDCYEAMINFCAGQFQNADKERLHALFLNKRLELVHHTCLQIGTLDHVTVYPREVLGLALKHSASHIILAHNHPFGSARPSRGDITMTRQLVHLAEGLGMAILDHIIFAGNDSFSFLKAGLLKPDRPDLLNRLSPRRPETWGQTEDWE